jgi:hypothetical protein
MVLPVRMEDNMTGPRTMMVLASAVLAGSLLATGAHAGGGGGYMGGGFGGARMGGFSGGHMAGIGRGHFADGRRSRRSGAGFAARSRGSTRS